MCTEYEYISITFTFLVEHYGIPHGHVVPRRSQPTTDPTNYELQTTTHNARDVAVAVSIHIKQSISARDSDNESSETVSESDSRLSQFLALACANTR